MTNGRPREDAARAVAAYGPDADLYRSAGEWPQLSIADAFRRHVGRRPDHPAVATVEGVLSYAELDARSDALALALTEIGLEIGDPVIFQMGNELETVVSFYGVLKAGLVPVCSIPNHRLHEITSIADAAGARAHIFQADYRGYDLASLSGELADACPDVTVRIEARGDGSGDSFDLSALIDGVDPVRARTLVDEVQSRLSPEDPAVFQLSGGTTGVPKVIPHTHATYLSIADRWSSNLGWNERAVNMHYIPIMHHAGLGTALVPTHFVGGTVVLARAVDAALLVELIERHGVTWMHFNLAALRPLLDHAATHPCDFGSVERVMWGFVRPELAAQAEALLDAEVVASFGMGEGVHLAARPDDPPEIRRHTVGCAIGAHDEVVVRELDSEDPVPDGEIGELTFKGPGVIRSYLSREHSETAFTSDGFLRSGDLGRAHLIAGRRCFTVDGRLKDQISRGGEKLMAAELEHLLADHPDVREVAAVGIPDPRLGERVGVVVVPEPHSRDLSAEALRERLVAYLDERQVAKYKWPERLVIADALPKTAIGKVRKNVLRSEMETDAASTG